MKASFYKTRAIVLRSYNIAEADLGLELLSRGLGLVKAVLKGIRKTKRRSRLPFELGSLSEFDFYNNDREWKSIKNYNLILSPDSLRGSYRGLIILSYITQLFYKHILPGKEEDKLYELLEGALKYLEQNSFEYLMIVFIKLRIIYLSGLLPDFTFCPMCNKKDSVASGIVWKEPYESWYCRDCSKPGEEYFSGKISEFLREAPYRKYSLIKEKFNTLLSAKNDLYKIDQTFNYILNSSSGSEIKCSGDFYKIVVGFDADREKDK